MTKNSKNRQFRENFGFMVELLKQSKIKTLIFSVFVVIALLTGIIVAIKMGLKYENIDDFGLFSSNFFTRLLSMLLIALICFGCSFNKFLFPFALLFLMYRSYLLGLNIVLIIIASGLTGIVSLIIIIPCQLIALVSLMLFYILMAKTHSDFKHFGVCQTPNQKVKLILLILVLLVVICLLESLLLALFSPKVILVI